MRKANELKQAVSACHPNSCRSRPSRWRLKAEGPESGGPLARLNVGYWGGKLPLSVGRFATTGLRNEPMGLVKVGHISHQAIPLSAVFIRQAHPTFALTRNPMVCDKGFAIPLHSRG